MDAAGSHVARASTAGDVSPIVVIEVHGKFLTPGWHHAFREKRQCAFGRLYAVPGRCPRAIAGYRGLKARGGVSRATEG